jgi:molecular chaperone GrpE
MTPFPRLIFAPADLICGVGHCPHANDDLKRMMADENQTTPEAQASASAVPASDAPGPAPGPTAAEFADLRDKMLRALADAENARRRAEKDVADARQYAVTSFAREMLGVGDNLRRALGAVTEDQRKGADEALKALLEGVEVTERGLEQTMGRFGVKRIDAKGKKFAPAFHQAMYEMPRDDVAPGTVLDEMQVGYVIGDRVLKPALVVVAKRAPAAQAANDDRPQAAEAQASASSGGVGDDG